METPETGQAPWLRRWNAVDGAIAFYTIATGVLVAIRSHFIAQAPSILVYHALILVGMALLPPRGSAWEKSPPNESGGRKTLRDSLRFVRYTYPLALVIVFFEEVQHTVNALAPAAPYWFEPYLYAADRWLLGELPSVLMSSWTGLVQDEILHAFYFSYYFIVVGGAVVAYVGPKGARQKHPGPGFATAMATAVFAYLLSFIWYPLLPARGPWENPDLMAGLTPFQGAIFTPLIDWIIGQGAVSGGCFPSSHVSGAWGMVLGLARFHRRPALLLAFLATGMSLACIYTRYHHAVDVPAGLLTASLGAWIGYRITSQRSRTSS